MRRIPRPYQDRAKQAFNDALAVHMSALIVHPTGTGKTVIMASIVNDWCSREMNVLLLAHRVELLDQAADKFLDELGYRPMVIQANRVLNEFEFSRRGMAFIASVQTLIRGKRLLRFRDNPIDLLLIDEAHHAVAKSYRRIIESLREFNPQMRVGGVTATPNRTDKKASGIVFEVVADQMEIGEAVGDGWLVPPCENKVIIDGIDFAKIKLTKNEFGETDFDPRELEARMNEEKPLHAVTQPLLENAGNRKWIVFAAGVEHAKRIAEILNRAKPGCAQAIDGQTHPPLDPNRIRILADFANPDHPLQFLVNFGILTEGTDVPICAGIAIARPTKSLMILIQMIGRSLRPLDGLVDPFPDAASRCHAIEQSTKPNALILIFIPKVANVRTLTVVDALGGNYDETTREVASQLTDEQPGAQVLDKLRQAALIAELFRDQKEVMLDVEAARRKQELLSKYIKPKVDYRLQGANGHATHAKSTTPNGRAGMATQKQVELLIGLGVSPEKAWSVKIGQAGAMIDAISKKRCTNKQRATLLKFGENPEVPMAEAKRLLDAIAKNGWRPLKRAE